MFNCKFDLHKFYNAYVMHYTNNGDEGNLFPVICCYIFFFFFANDAMKFE